MTAPVTVRRYNDGVAGWQPSETAPIVLRAQAGDTAAVAALYERYSDVVFRFVYFRVGNRPLAEDLCGEAWLRALRRLGSYEDQGKDFGAWIVTIARNLIADHFKSGRYRLEVTTGDVLDADCVERGPEGSPETAVVGHMTHLTLLDALKKLGEEQRDCLVFRFIRGYSVAETAAAMDKNEGAVKALQYRAANALAKLLQQELPELAEARMGRPRSVTCPRCMQRFAPPADKPSAKICRGCVRPRHPVKLMTQ